MREQNIQIQCGHYEQRLSFKGQDEVGELVQSFNRMAEALARGDANHFKIVTSRTALKAESGFSGLRV